jgi:hypothetical protein
MADTKQHEHMQSFADPRDDGSPVNEGPSLKQGTVADQLDMQRMGKTQQTKVSLISLTAATPPQSLFV